ncbi:hypothetical protein Ddc_02990 [Ditylenchus destructor]|nr:hypothetical protein Ddc_02990 [Ditylenchus destructor]
MLGCSRSPDLVFDSQKYGNHYVTSPPVIHPTNQSLRLVTLNDILSRPKRQCCFCPCNDNDKKKCMCMGGPLVVPPMGSTCLNPCVPALAPFCPNCCCCNDDDDDDEKVKITIDCSGCKEKSKKPKMIVLPGGPPPLPMPIGPPPVFYPVPGAPFLPPGPPPPFSFPPPFAFPPPPVLSPPIIAGPPPPCVPQCLPDCSSQCIQTVFPNCPNQCMPSCFSTCLSANQILPPPPPPVFFPTVFWTIFMALYIFVHRIFVHRIFVHWLIRPPVNSSTG